MSKKGIQKVADLLSQMQTACHELLELGAEQPINERNIQDIRLANVIFDAKKLLGDKFTTETLKL